MLEYKKALDKVLKKGMFTTSRAGEVISYFGMQIEFDLGWTFPATTIKKLYFESVANELAGFLRCETDASKMGSGIWLKDAERWSGGTDMGRIYGSQWRDWQGPQGAIDQLQEVITTIKDDSTNRRLIVSAWNPGELHLMCLPPCHYAMQFNVHEGRLNCIWVQRSVDMFLGLPFDIASYALLTHIIANETNLRPGKLIGQLGDCHIYTNHMPQVEEILKRSIFPGPMLRIDNDTTINNFTADKVEIVDYRHHGPVQAELNVGF